MIADPFPLLARLQQSDPVHWDEEMGSWLITRYEDVGWILRHPELFSSEIYVRDKGRDLPIDPADIPLARWCVQFRRHEMIQNDPPEHARMRALLRRPFSSAHLDEHWRSAVQETVSRLLDAVADRGRMDLMADVAKPLPFFIISEMLGIAEQDRPLVWEHANKRLESLMSLKPDRVRRSAEGIRETSRYLDTQLDERRGCPVGDLLGVLTDAEETGTYTRAEAQANAQLIIDAGFVTTIDLICNGALALMRHPAQWEALVADPAGLAASATEECLRFDPPVPLSFRIATRDIEVGDKLVRQGQRVTWAMAAANRDPRAFADPDTFDIRRSPNPHLSFGAGVHLCLGLHLARMEGQEVFRALATRFPSLRLATADVEYEPVRGVHHLKRLDLEW